MVKALFNDAALRKSAGLTAVNSINWARVMAQIVYYVTASLSLGGPDRAPAFCVPTGNFGDIFAGYAAAKMGLPVAKLIVATHRNDILARFFAGGEIGSASCRARVCQYVYISVVAVSLKKKTNRKTN